MTQNICNICGANYEYHAGRWKCLACGAYKPEEFSNEETTLLYNAAQKLRLSDFYEAEKEYTDIIEKYPKNPNGYWGRLLSKYGIKYEEDFDGRKIPTCYAASMESVISDKDYLQAIALADAETRAYYTQQAGYMERVRKEWIEKAKKEKPYDIFICYKESDLVNNIDRTQDSIAAQDLYIHLTKQGYRVFFSRECLRDKVGEKYEPYIFNALSTAKVMLVYGSKSEYITSTWLKNEWTRYEKRVQSGEKKPNSLLVACDGFSPAELPKALSAMQCFDANNRNFYSDLDETVKKIIKGEKKKKATTTENKKSKKAPIVLTLTSVMIAVLLCVFLPNALKNGSTTSIKNPEFGIVITASENIFDENSAVVVDKSTDGVQHRAIVNAVNHAKSIDLQNTVVYDIECGVNITNDVTIQAPYTQSLPNSTVKVFYVSDDQNLIEEHGCNYKNGIVEFKTSHLSYYVIGEIENSQTQSTETTGNPSVTTAENKKETTTLHFNANGGSGTMSAQTIIVGESTDLTTCSFSKTGYTFSGWATSANGSVIYQDGRPFKAESKGEVTLFAIWEPNSNSLTFDANGGTGSMASIEAKTDETVAIPENAFTYPGYTFVGWSDSKNGSAKYTEKQSYTMTSASTTMLYAVWEANTNTLTLKSNNGTAEETSINIKTDESLTLPANTFIKIGYTFVGWGVSEDSSANYADKATYKMGAESTALYAIWKPNANKIVFNANGGAGSMDDQIIRTDEKANLNVCTYTRDGYTFAGWAKSSTGNIEYADQSSYLMDAEATHTLYAIWVKASYLITYHMNGGTNNVNNPAGYDINTETIIFADPKRDGYMFAGWYADDTLQTKITKIPKGSTGHVQLYASWSPNTYSVSFLSNGGTGTMQSQGIKADQSAPLNKNTFSREGYTFAGWSTTSSGSVSYQDQEQFTIGVKDVKLYAIWDANTNRIVFDANGGSGAMPDQSIKTGVSAYLSACKFTRKDYIFVGWSTSASGSAAYADTSYYTMGTKSSTTLYAVWKPQSYSISYDLQGGSMSGQKTSYDTTTSSFSLPVPTKSGYTFIGWSGTDIVGMQSSVTISKGSSGNRSYTANWEASKYTVTLNANGGSVSQSTLNVTYNESVAYPTPSKLGYSFVGWFNGSTQYQSGKWTYAGNITLTAKWTPNSDTVYTVNHYQMDAGTGQYVLRDTDTLQGTTDSTVIPATKTYAGFSAPSASTVKIKADGSLVVNYYYDLVTYTVSFVTNGGDQIASLKCNYGQEVNLPVAKRDGYTFGGWFTDIALSEQVARTTVFSDTTLYAWWAEENKAGDFTYSIVDNYATITAYNGSSTTMVVPSFIGDFPVKNISGSAFVGKAELRKVVIPNGVETIGYGAFHGCSALEEMTLPFVGQCLDNQFADTNTLFCYIFGSSKFANSVAASQINPASGGSNTYHLPSSLTKVNITGGYLRHGAFSGCTNIQVVTLSNIRAFEERVFYGCSGLTTVNVPEGIVSIPSAFESCTSLTNVTLPSGLKSIKGAFTWCVSLTTVSLPDSIEDIEGAFACSGITNIVIPPKVKDISSTFNYCGALTSIEIPNTVTSIGSVAFMESGITSISLPESIQSIGNNAFYGCYNLKSVSIPATLNNIGGSAFANCTLLKNVYITDLNKWCNIQFESWSSNPLACGGTLFLNNEVVTSLDKCNGSIISQYAFWKYDKFNIITIPDTVIEIGAHAFESCQNLQMVTINNNVVTIGDSAFGYCDQLTIYCEAAAKPSGWNDSWNKGQYSDNGCNVIWFYNGDVWDGTTSYSFAGGTGAASNPYLISTAEELAYVATAVNQGGDTFEGKYLRLTENIHLNNLEWSPIGYVNQFSGHFDGSNHTIFGLSVTEQTRYGGLFGYINGGTVHNLNIAESMIDIDGYAGMICGFANNSDTTTVIFKNCHIEGSVTTTGYAGGVVGYCNGTTEKCTSDIKVVANSDSTSGRSSYVTVGGIAGLCTTIRNCFTSGSVGSSGGSLYYHNSYVGGIVGHGGTIENCYTSATVRAATYASSYAGGIAGKASTITNSFSVGNISTSTYSLNGTYGGSYIGRIIGHLDDSDVITNCHADSLQTIKRITNSGAVNTKTTNSHGILQFTHTLQSENFIYNTLGWSSDIWQINAGEFPTLK